MRKERIYVCHTFYHAYITFLKEMVLPKEQQGGATLVLSNLSTDLTSLIDKVKATEFFEEVIRFDEKPFWYFKELDKYKKDRGNIVINMFYRIAFSRKFAKLEAPFVPVDFREYKEIYVYCDSDPIGLYLNMNHIYYHAVEDGLDTLKTCDNARVSNIGHFNFKNKMAKMNLIFIENGHSKYCLDMEINDKSVLKYDRDFYIEVPRKPLFDRLTSSDKDILLRAFMDNKEEIEMAISEARKAKEERGQKSVLILSDPVCDLEIRKHMMDDLLAEYGQGTKVFIKPHPRDKLDYKSLYPDIPQFGARVPMEILNLMEGAHFDTVISIFTELDAITFADEKLRLAEDFMDKYENPKIHRHNDNI